MEDDYLRCSNQTAKTFSSLSCSLKKEKGKRRQSSLSKLALLLFLMPPSAAHAAISLPFTINLSENTIVDTTGGTPRIAVDVGGITRYATYTSGTGTSALTFTLSPQAGDIDLDGVSVSSSIQLNGGTIKDNKGNDATLTFTPPNTTNVKVNYPSLGMDFIYDADGRYTLNGTVYNDLSSFLTATGGSFTRASIGTYFNSSGTLQTAASGVPRFDHDPVTHAPKGIFIEEQRTNLILNSNRIDTWSISGGGTSSISANFALAPDGTMTADSISNTHAVNPIYSYLSIATTAPAGSSVTFSLFVKNTSGTFNLTWAGLSQVIGGGEICTDLLNGWKRCSLTGTASVLNATAYPQVYFAPLSSGYFWGAQLEQGSFPTSYIPTTTAAVTRTADIFSIPTTNTWFSAASGGLYSEAYLSDISTSRIFSAFTGSTSYSTGRGFLFRSSSSSVYSSGGNCCSANLGVPHTSNSLLKVAAAYEGSTAVIASNNTSATSTNNDFTGSGTTQLFLGGLHPSSSTQSIGSGNILRLKYYPTRPSTTQLELSTK